MLDVGNQVKTPCLLLSWIGWGQVPEDSRPPTSSASQKSEGCLRGSAVPAKPLSNPGQENLGGRSKARIGGAGGRPAENLAAPPHGRKWAARL